MDLVISSSDESQETPKEEDNSPEKATEPQPPLPNSPRNKRKVNDVALETSPRVLVLHPFGFLPEEFTMNMRMHGSVALNLPPLNDSCVKLVWVENASNVETASEYFSNLSSHRPGEIDLVGFEIQDFNKEPLTHVLEFEILAEVRVHIPSWERYSADVNFMSSLDETINEGMKDALFPDSL